MEKPHKTLNVSAGQDETTAAAPGLEAGSTLNASEQDFANLLFQDSDQAQDFNQAQDSDQGLPPPVQSPPPVHLNAALGLNAVSGLKAKEIERIVRITGDASSRRRWEQVYDLAADAGLLVLWDKARAATCKAIQKAGTDQKAGIEPINAETNLNAGAYFNGVVARLLNEARPGLIPVGTPEEREAVRQVITASLASAVPPFSHSSPTSNFHSVKIDGTRTG